MSVCESDLAGAPQLLSERMAAPTRTWLTGAHAAAILDAVERWTQARGYAPRTRGFIAGATPWSVDTHALRRGLRDDVLIQRLGPDGQYKEYWTLDLHTTLVWALAVEHGDAIVLVGRRPHVAWVVLEAKWKWTDARDILTVHADQIQTEGDPLGTTLALWLAGSPEGLVDDVERLLREVDQ